VKFEYIFAHKLFCFRIWCICFEVIQCWRLSVRVSWWTDWSCTGQSNSRPDIHILFFDQE